MISLQWYLKILIFFRKIHTSQLMHNKIPKALPVHVVPLWKLEKKLKKKFIVSVDMQNIPDVRWNSKYNFVYNELV